MADSITQALQIDETNSLSYLKNNALVWSKITDDVGDWYNLHMDKETIAYKELSYKISFPEPQDIQINMMPIRFCSKGEYETVPDYCKQYIPMILNCPLEYLRMNFPRDERVMYLTIHESLVPVGECQRRPGLHVERPSMLTTGRAVIDRTTQEYDQLQWGLGYSRDGFLIDGIYCASNLSNTTNVWPVLIKNSHEVSDTHGGIEHMRNHLGPSHTLEANEMCWMTDCTPHETLPVKAEKEGDKFVYRQFFRLIVGKISIWHSKHNTANSLCAPDALIFDGDKFSN